MYVNLWYIMGRATSSMGGYAIVTLTQCFISRVLVYNNTFSCCLLLYLFESYGHFFTLLIK